MPYGNLLADVVQSSTAGTPPQFNDGNGTQTGTLCRAWVNFNGVTTASIRASFNVSSVTRNGTGDYTVNFTNALADANYSAMVTPGGTSGLAGVKSPIESTVNTTTTCRIATFIQTGVADMLYVNVAIFR